MSRVQLALLKLVLIETDEPTRGTGPKGALPGGGSSACCAPAGA